MLKIKTDADQDYLNYLDSFIISCLSSLVEENITEDKVVDALSTKYGLAIPNRTVQIILQRFAKSSYINKNHGTYTISNKLPKPDIENKKADAERHINAVVKDIKYFWQRTNSHAFTDDEIMKSITSVLSDFTTPALSAYLRGTVIPDPGEHTTKNHILVGKYLLEVSTNNPERFESFLVLLQGHMISNAILCPDLKGVSNSYENVTFFLDTPFVVQYFGFEGVYKQESAKELITLLKKLKGKVGLFKHTFEEVEMVLSVSAGYIDKEDGRGPIVDEARRKNTTKSDILLFVGKLQKELENEKISVIPSPRYSEKFQIGESEFEQLLGEEMRYSNKNAKRYDINSVRSIYELRKGSSPPSIEKSKAILVTTNSAFAKAAFRYGQENYKETKSVSSVITDFSLGNMAWLKAPMDAPSLPAKSLLAYSYASMSPPKALLSKLLEEIEKLAKSGDITAHDHQLFRSNPMVNDELVSMTMGSDASLSKETVVEMINRIENEITKEGKEKLNQEQLEHQKTKEKNKKLLVEKEEQIKKAHSRCDKKANRRYNILLSIFFLILIAGFIFSVVGYRSSNVVVSNILLFAFLVISLLSTYNLCQGVTIKNIGRKMSNRYKKKCLEKEEVRLGYKFKKEND